MCGSQSPLMDYNPKAIYDVRFVAVVSIHSVFFMFSWPKYRIKMTVIRSTWECGQVKDEENGLNAFSVHISLQPSDQTWHLQLWCESVSVCLPSFLLISAVDGLAKRTRCMISKEKLTSSSCNPLMPSRECRVTAGTKCLLGHNILEQPYYYLCWV